MDSMVEIVSLTVAGTVSMMKFVTNKMEHVDPVPKVIMERNAIQVWLQSLYKFSFFNRIKLYTFDQRTIFKKSPLCDMISANPNTAYAVA